MLDNSIIPLPYYTAIFYNTILVLVLLAVLKLFDKGYSIDVSGSGIIAASGYYRGTVDFDPNSGTHNLTANNSDIFILKLNNCRYPNI